MTSGPDTVMEEVARLEAQAAEAEAQILAARPAPPEQERRGPRVGAGEAWRHVSRTAMRYGPPAADELWIDTLPDGHLVLECSMERSAARAVLLRLAAELED